MRLLNKILAVYLCLVSGIMASTGDEFQDREFHAQSFLAIEGVDGRISYKTQGDLSEIPDGATTLFGCYYPVKTLEDMHLWLDFLLAASAVPWSDPSRPEPTAFSKSNQIIADIAEVFCSSKVYVEAGRVSRREFVYKRKPLTISAISDVAVEDYWGGRDPNPEYKAANFGFCYLSDSDEKPSSVAELADHLIMMVTTRYSNDVLSRWYGVHGITRGKHWMNSSKPHYPNLSLILHSFAAQMHPKQSFVVSSPLEQMELIIRRHLPGEALYIDAKRAEQTAIVKARRSGCYITSKGDFVIYISSNPGKVKSTILSNSWMTPGYTGTIVPPVFIDADVLRAYDPENPYPLKEITTDDIMREQIEFMRENSALADLFNMMPSMTGGAAIGKRT